MGRVGREHLAHPRSPRNASPRNLLRGLLLALLLAGLFGMHVLTAEDSGSGHGALPMIGASGHDSDMTAPLAGVSTDAPSSTLPMDVGAALVAAGTADLLKPAAPDHGMDPMAGCILFLVAGAAAIILAMLRYRRGRGSTGPGRPGLAALTDLRRRGPPGRYRPRVALCVIRT